MGTPRFYLMFVIFLLGASSGLMILGALPRIATIQAGITDTALLVSFMAIMNAVGRIVGGFISDKIGRVNTLILIFIIQMANMAGFLIYNNLPLIILGIIGAGFCFGAILSIFPALTADQFGLKNYGQNYGIVYLAWGLSGVVAPVIAANIYNRHGNYDLAYIICVIMMAFLLAVTFVLKKEVKKN